mmetsp:Transcript_22762/g.21967  ORF Transcript_22762/g.21967 Transcript_22762/m.21967 type:complete len:126 (-) Transcript_22762:1771-2148(-)
MVHQDHLQGKEAPEFFEDSLLGDVGGDESLRDLAQVLAEELLPLYQHGLLLLHLLFLLLRDLLHLILLQPTSPYLLRSKSDPQLWRADVTSLGEVVHHLLQLCPIYLDQVLELVPLALIFLDSLQ